MTIVHISFKLQTSVHQKQSPGVFCKKDVLKNFAKLTEKHLCLFFNKVAGFRPPTILRKNLWHRCFPVNFAKFLRKALFIEHLWWLPLVHFTFLTKKHLPNKVYYFAHA